jgi:hypothetical protein
MLFSRLQLRRLAAFVLLGWVFALGVSVAHACGLVSGLADDGHGQDTAPSRVVQHSEAKGAAADDQAPLSVNPSCDKFCDDTKNAASGSGTIAAAAPAHLNSVPLLLLQPDVAILPLRAAWMRDQGRRPARQLPIELLRLTL